MSPLCNLVWSNLHRDVQLVVVSGRRVVRANHVASAEWGHLIHSGAVLAASSREAHLSVLWLRSLRESNPFSTSLSHLCLCHLNCQLIINIVCIIFCWLICQLVNNHFSSTCMKLIHKLNVMIWKTNDPQLHISVRPSIKDVICTLSYHGYTLAPLIDYMLSSQTTVMEQANQLRYHWLSDTLRMYVIVYFQNLSDWFWGILMKTLIIYDPCYLVAERRGEQNLKKNTLWRWVPRALHPSVKNLSSFDW